MLTIITWIGIIAIIVLSAIGYNNLNNKNKKNTPQNLTTEKNMFGWILLISIVVFLSVLILAVLSHVGIRKAINNDYDPVPGCPSNTAGTAFGVAPSTPTQNLAAMQQVTPGAVTYVAQPNPYAYAAPFLAGSAPTAAVVTTTA